jgi:hypothetical protein
MFQFGLDKRRTERSTSTSSHKMKITCQEEEKRKQMYQDPKVIVREKLNTCMF